MKLPNFKRLFTSDYADEFKELVETLANSLNYGIQVLYDAINGNITLQDNVYCTIKTFNTSVNINGIPTINGTNAALTFSLNNTSSRVVGVQVLNINLIKNTASDPTVYPSSGITISWQQSGNTVIVNNITGLNGTYNGNNLVGKTWSITVVAYQQPITN